jgi:hypothetical protein
LTLGKIQAEGAVGANWEGGYWQDSARRTADSGLLMGCLEASHPPAAIWPRRKALPFCPRAQAQVTRQVRSALCSAADAVPILLSYFESLVETKEKGHVKLREEIPEGSQL